MIQEVKLILFILICLTSVIIGFYYNKSKIGYISIISIFLLLMLITKDSYDISNYRRAYDEHIFHSKEWLFDWIRQLSWKHGLSFDSFRSIWVFFTVIILYKGIKKYSEYASLVATYFLIIPFLMGFITQMRNSLAGAIIIYALPFLLSDKKNDCLKYIVCVIVASLIHIMSLIYLVLLIPRVININYKIFHRLCIIGTCLFTIIIFNSSDLVISWIEILLDRIPNGFLVTNLLRIRIYFQEGMRSSIMGFFFATGHQLVLYYYSLKSYKRCIYNGKKVFYKNSIEKAGKIMDTLLLVIPLYAISMQMQRIIFICSPLFYGMIVQNSMELHNEKKRGGLVPRDLIFLLFFLVSIYIISMYHTPEDFFRGINGMWSW